MTKFHRHHIALIVAFLMALLIGFPSIFIDKPDVFLRMILAASLYLVSQDVLAGLAISKGKRGLGNPNRWVQSFYLILIFGTYMLLALWGGMDSILHFLPRVLIGAFFFGLFLGLASNGPEYRFKKFFELEHPIGKLFYVWPIFIVLLVPVFAYLIPHLTVSTLFLLPIGIGFLMPRYKRTREGSVLWTYLPRLVGFTLLAVAIIIDTAVSNMG